MRYRIFISSVQREFAKERKALADYIRKDAILGKFFEVFLFEEVLAQERSASEVYLGEVDKCDIYLGILGELYGNTNAKGVSATEQEYNQAAKVRKERICFVKRGIKAEERQAKFIGRVNADVVRNGFSDYDELRTGVYAALARYLENKHQISSLPFDCSCSAGVQFKDISVTKIRKFVRDARIERKWNMPLDASATAVLNALRLIDDDGRILNSATLLFGKDPQRFFPTSCVKCAWFLTDQVEKPMADHQIFTGDVFKMVDDATFFVMSHISNEIGGHDSPTSGKASSRFELPERAVNEAIVNAICHRDYTSAASVQVMLFKDRLEVWSPGPIPKGMTLAKMYKPHKSYPANPLLAYAMYQRKYVEQTGTGTRDMIARCREWGLKDPKWYVEDGDDFVSVIYRNAPDALVSKDKSKDKGKDKSSVKSSVRSSVRSSVKTEASRPNLTDDHILSILSTNPRITLDEIAGAMSLTKRGVEKAVKRLRDANRLRKVGGKRFGYWEVMDLSKQTLNKNEMNRRQEQ